MNSPKHKLLPKYILIAIAIGGGGLYFYLNQTSTSHAKLYNTDTLKIGNLTGAISSTGTLQPEEVIDVGAQVAGLITEFGADKFGAEIDYGSQVEAGTILARIDDRVYKADVDLAAAQVAEAETSVELSQLEQSELKAIVHKAEKEWQRASLLRPTSAMSQSAYDMAYADFEIAKARLAIGVAGQTQAENVVLQKKALLDKAQRNLEYSVISSPVEGVIIDRRVNIGQTVVASLNTPSLFLIAKDLRKMQIWVAVNEADISAIFPGQEVEFTVDTFPGKTFGGRVGRIRLNASMTQNVVTYTVEVSTDNSDNLLLPYLTANVKFIVSRKSGVLLVPNSALRWTPQDKQIAPRKDSRPLNIDELRQKPISDEAKTGGKKTGTLWIVADRFVTPVSVELGTTDNFFTEATISDSVREGLEVVVGNATNTPTEAGVSPFAPRIAPRGASGQGRPSGHGN